MTNELVTQVRWELESFLSYVTNPNPDKRERGFELEIMKELESSIERKVNALMELAHND